MRPDVPLSIFRQYALSSTHQKETRRKIRSIGACAHVRIITYQLHADVAWSKARTSCHVTLTLSQGK